MNVVKEVKNLHYENCNTWLQESENTYKWKTCHAHGLEEIILVKCLPILLVKCLPMSTTQSIL